MVLGISAAVEPVMMIDAPFARRNQMRHGYRDGVHHADQVDVDRVLEIQRLGVPHGHRHDAGVGA